MKKEQVIEILQGHGLVLNEEEIVQGGVKLIFSKGVMVTVYHTGSINPQGKHMPQVKLLLGWVASSKKRRAFNENSPDDCF